MNIIGLPEADVFDVFEHEWRAWARRPLSPLLLIRPMAEPPGPVPPGSYEFRLDPVSGHWVCGPAGAPLVAFMQAAHGWADRTFWPPPFGRPGSPLWLVIPHAATKKLGTVNAVRFKRAHDVTLHEAREAGIAEYLHEVTGRDTTEEEQDIWRNRTSLENLAAVWDEHHGAEFPWASNPWVSLTEVRPDPKEQP